MITIDASEYFLKIALDRIPKSFTEISIKPLCLAPTLGLHNGQIASFFPTIPNFYPDFIYLDGPDPDQVLPGDFQLAGSSELTIPMAADLLRIEHLLWPGTILVVDGRGATARFLRNAFTRNWAYSYHTENDQHHFLLQEDSWGNLITRHTMFRQELESDNFGE